MQRLGDINNIRLISEIVERCGINMFINVNDALKDGELQDEIDTLLVEYSTKIYQAIKRRERITCDKKGK